MARLTPEQVEDIRNLDANTNLTQVEIAKRVNRSRSLISDILCNRAYKEETTITRKPLSSRELIKQANPTDARILSLEAENVLLKDERNLERRKSKANAKYQGIFTAVSDLLANKLSSIPSFPVKESIARKEHKSEIVEHCVMHLSDGHHDQVVSPQECGGLETYNFSVSCCRAEKYVNTVIRWTQDVLYPQFRFTDLWILAYGDHTSGEIHNHVERSAFLNQMDNTLAIGNLHALMFRDLAPHFDRVHVVYVPGNHGRRSIKKDYHGAHKNWDYMVAKIASIYCLNIPNIDFIIPNSWSATLNINGIGFHIFHGDDVIGNLGIPYYGLQRKQQSLLAVEGMKKNLRVRYFCCGHFHKPATIGDRDGELLVNGPWVATDAYAFNRFAGFTEPSQWLHGVHKNHGISWRLNVNLRSENEKRGPKRYKIA